MKKTMFIMAFILMVFGVNAQSTDHDYALDYEDFFLNLGLEFDDAVKDYFVSEVLYEDASLHIYDQGFYDAAIKIRYDELVESGLKDDDGNVHPTKEMEVTYKKVYFEDEPTDFTITLVFEETEEGLKVIDVWIPEPF